MMPNRRGLIVNADDFGQSPGVNRGIAQAHENGIVTSASLMVRWPAASAAAAYAKQHPELSVGLHFDIGEWSYRCGEWIPLYQVVEKSDAHAVGEELRAQVAAFRALMGRNPTHLDSHQHFHRNEPAQSTVLSLGRDIGIPVRDFCPTVHYTGEFYGQTDEGGPNPEGITVGNLCRILEGLAAPCTELGCHPARGRDLETMYQAEREQEVSTLCDPRVREAIRELGIELCSFNELALMSQTQRHASLA